MLSIKCTEHPRYQAKRRSYTGCAGCDLIFVLRWQNTKRADEKLGGLNPYQFFDADEGASLLSASESGGK